MEMYTEILPKLFRIIFVFLKTSSLNVYRFRGDTAAARVTNWWDFTVVPLMKLTRSRSGPKYIKSAGA